MKWGFTFSTKYCRELELDPVQTLQELFKFIKFDSVRLCAYWDRIERETGVWDFTELDQLVEIAGQNSAQVTMAMGRKVPRWPEFHEPQWTQFLSAREMNEALYQYITQVISHYKDDPTIVRWQIENEPLLDVSFLKTNTRDRIISEETLKEEVLCVKQNDQRPILLTQSSDLGKWDRLLEMGDQLGINIYQTSYDGDKNRYIRHKQSVRGLNKKIEKANKEIIVAELQAEPWGPAPAKDLDFDEVRKSLSEEDLVEILEKVKELNVNEVWLWGAEWWIFADSIYGSNYLSIVTDLINY